MSIRPLIDLTAAAERLGVDERFLRTLYSERRIPYVKVGRFVRFKPEDIDAYIEANTHPAIDQPERHSRMP